MSDAVAGCCQGVVGWNQVQRQPSISFTSTPTIGRKFIGGQKGCIARSSLDSEFLI
jgi:hypothetical protein